MNNESKGLVAGIAFIAAVAIVILCQLYHPAHAENWPSKPKTCQGNDPRVVSPYPISECKTVVDFVTGCLYDRVYKNHEARLKYGRECVDQPTQKHTESKTNAK